MPNRIGRKNCVSFPRMLPCVKSFFSMKLPFLHAQIKTQALYSVGTQDSSPASVFVKVDRGKTDGYTFYITVWEKKMEKHLFLIGPTGIGKSSLLRETLGEKLSLAGG